MHGSAGAQAGVDAQGIEKEVWIDCYSDPLGWDGDDASGGDARRGHGEHYYTAKRDPGGIEAFSETLQCA